MISIEKRCSFCTRDGYFRVCEKHIIPAGGCGFMPRYFGGGIITPKQAVRIWKGKQ